MTTWLKYQPENLQIRSNTTQHLQKNSYPGTKYTRLDISPFKMGFIFNIYRNITDINFPPVTYVYTVQMKEEKNNNLNPNLCSETSLIENKAPISDKLQQCRKSLHRCQNTCNSGNDHRPKWKLSGGRYFKICPYTVT